MAVLIDEPRWWFRGRRWSHLVSDVSLAELQTFADAAGMPRHIFQGDHYDIPEEHYADMLAAGAVPTPSRVLLRRLHAAGLRLGPAERRARKAAHTARAAATIRSADERSKQPRGADGP